MHTEPNVQGECKLTQRVKDGASAADESSNVKMSSKDLADEEYN
jgi:hypothetical protein